MPDMFCFQCQQTAGGTGCVRTGVCTVRRALESAYGNRKKCRKRRKTKEKARCGGMNAAGFVELTVVETATSSMRTKRSTN